MIHVLHILVVQPCGICLGKFLPMVCKCLMKQFHDGRHFEKTASLQIQRSGVGDVGRKMFLIDIEADAGDGAVQTVAHYSMFDEDAGNFLPVYIDVVGPFYLDIRKILRQDLSGAEGEILVEEKLPGGGQPGVEEETGQKILAPFAEPGVGPHAASR